MTMSRFLGHLARTPLHPQWLLGPRRIPTGLSETSGILLDIGAADRWIEKHLASDAHYIALDYPVTGRNLYGAWPHVFADAAMLPFPDASFEGVLCLEVLEHVPDPARVMLEIARVLKPGGRTWISMPFLYPVHDAPFDFQRYTEFGLRRDLSRAGMEVDRLQRTGHSIRAAGLLACLAVVGPLRARAGAWSLLLPLAMIMVLAINVSAFLMSFCWPDWDRFATGHEVAAHKL